MTTLELPRGSRLRNETKRRLAVDLYRQKKHTIDEICRTVGITKPTLYAYVAEAESIV